MTSFAPVPGYRRYIVSSEGRVYSERGEVPARRHPQGYAQIDLYEGGRKSSHLVHRVVALAFHGDPQAGHEVAHFNNDKMDNRASNLGWVTHTENIRHKVAHGTDPIGERHGCAKLTEADVCDIRRLAAGGMTQRELARTYMMSNQQISNIVTRKAWRHVA